MRCSVAAAHMGSSAGSWGSNAWCSGCILKPLRPSDAIRAISAAGSSHAGCMAPNGTMRSLAIEAAQSLIEATCPGLVATGWTTEMSTPVRSISAMSPETVPS